MFKIKNVLIGCALALGSLTTQANPVGEHFLINEATAAQYGFNLQGLQWVSGSETVSNGISWNQDFADTRYATAEEVTALLAGADLNYIDQVIGDGFEIRELQYGASDRNLTGESRCKTDGSYNIGGSLCILREQYNFSLDNVETWSNEHSYSAHLLIVNPDYIKPREPEEWDSYTEVSPNDGAQLDLSGLTWMRFGTIKDMSSKEIKEALASGGSLSDWRWATAEELGALLKSDHDEEFSKVFFGSNLYNPPLYLFYGGLEVNAAECNPLAEDIERKSLDTSCRISMPGSDAKHSYEYLHNEVHFGEFLFLGNSNRGAAALVRK